MSASWDPMEQIGAAVPAILVAAVFFLIGAVLVFWGWRIYHVALVLVGAALGALVGLCFAPVLGIASVFVALPLAILCGFLAIVVQDLGVFLVGGLWGAFLVLNAPGMFAAPAARYLVAGLAFLILGILAVALWRPMITFLIAMFGAGLIARAVALGADRMKPGASSQWGRQHPWLIFIAVVVVAAIGLYFQEEESAGEGDG